VLLVARLAYAGITGTNAIARPDNSLIVEIQVTAGGSAAKIAVTYQTEGVDPLISRFVPVAADSPTTITIGRLRANGHIRTRCAPSTTTAFRRDRPTGASPPAGCRRLC
jgi:hypothetical protein